MTPGFLESTPIEFKDFSGGLTDNVLQGDPTRFAKADNLLITTDHKLEVRYGTVPYDPDGFQLNDSLTRVTSLFTGINESLLFGQSGRNLYIQTPDDSYGTEWSPILGPTDNESVTGGDIYNQLTTGEFQHQIFFASDASILPGKIFRDQNNEWKSLTVGMPKMKWIPHYVDDFSLIQACIQRANELRASFISHMEDQAALGSGTSTAYQHKYIDKWSLSYLKAETFDIILDPEYPGPDPMPTPAPDATDEDTLYALCAALALSYEHHRDDLSGDFPETGHGDRLYHQDIYLYPPIASYTSALSPYYGGTSGTVPNGLGINSRLVLSGIVTNPAKAAAFLDELYTKWNNHMLSPFSHSISNSLALMDRYVLDSTNTTGKLLPLYTSPYQMQVTPDYTEFCAFAQWIKDVWNKHSNSTGSNGNNTHPQVDPYGTITLDDPTDFDSAALIIFWARWLYGFNHVYDSNVAIHNRITFSSTNGSANITSVNLTSSGAATTLAVDSWVITTFQLFNDLSTLNKRAARVVASGAGTATLSKTCNTTGAGRLAQNSESWNHATYCDGNIDTAQCDTVVTSAQAAEFIASGPGSISTTLDGWLTKGTEFLDALGAHLANGERGATTPSTHSEGLAIKNDMQGLSAIGGNAFYLPSTATYAWASFYRYLYTVEPNGLIYVDEGAPVFSASTEVLHSYPVGTTITSYNDSYFDDIVITQENFSATIGDIPQLVNSSITNYDTTVSVVPIPESSADTGFYQNLTIELYRTTDGGTTFFYLDSIENDGTGESIVTYEDTTNEDHAKPGDDALDEHKVMYTSGGVVANDQPPFCKFIHSFNNFMYYGAITDTGQFFPQRVRQSIQSQPDSAPATFFDDLEDELVGLSSTRTNLLGLCKNSIYRMEGSFNSTGQGAMVHERISATMGALNARSIIQTEIGVFFAGTDGFYYTDGFQLIKISLELNNTYRSLTSSENQKQRIYGAYDKNTRRIWWAMQSNPTSADNDVLFVYYLDYGVKPSGVFTKAFSTDSWSPASIAFYKGELIIGDRRGYLFKTDFWTKSDPALDVAEDPSDWDEVSVPWWLRSCALDMGSSAVRKWITRIHAVGQNLGNADIQINSINDMGTMPSGANSTLPLAPVQYRANPMWGDARIIWGDEEFDWKYDGKFDIWRRFPARSMRSNFKQVEFKPGSFRLYEYEDFPEFAYATVDATLKTATLQTPSGYSSLLWPLDILGYSISFDTDNFETEFEITGLDVTSKIITFSDASDESETSAAATWRISGTPKSQRIRITAFDIHTAVVGDEFNAFNGEVGNSE